LYSLNKYMLQTRSHQMQLLSFPVVGAVIGAGTYGTVYKATCRKTGKEFALKCHKHGVEDIHDCFIHNGMMAILMSYAPYTLSNMIHSGHLRCHEQVRALEMIPLSFAARFSVQAAHALSYMHGLNLVHRDLTPVNVLVNISGIEEHTARVGLCTQIESLGSYDVVTFLGTREKANANLVAQWGLCELVYVFTSIYGLLVFREGLLGAPQVPG
uniref:mitogen-activated protein kinase kinase n=1 Tax=Sander lucioperca TaxID=283035 RepID=A0A8D0ARY1_SANLU